MARRLDQNAKLEGVRMIFRNFAGAPTPLNPQGGKRAFNIVLTREQHDAMAADGWNVKERPPAPDADEGAETLYHIPVEVRYGVIPPAVWLVTQQGKRKTLLTEDTVMMLDHADIVNVDVIIRPYNWTMPNGSEGIKAYVKTMFVSINEDELEAKYASLPDTVPDVEVPGPPWDEEN